MFTSMWFMSIATLLMVDIRTGAIQQKDNEARRCYTCSQSGNVTCDQSLPLTTIECPADRQYCATVAVAPNFTSSLQCVAVAAVAAETPCSLKYTKQILELTCVCNEQLCNAPFRSELLNDLLNFSSRTPHNKSADFTKTFFNSYFKNFSTENLYKMITVETTLTTVLPMEISSKLTSITTATVSTHPTTAKLQEVDVPRAEALKQEATVPSDDDEDESEGSGSYEDTRSQRHPASAPAEPSSLLPANENKSPPLYTNLFLASFLFAYFIV